MTVTPDGTGKTAHFVFDIFNASKTEVKSITCKHVAGAAAMTGETQASITVHPEFEECEFIGQPTTINTTGCNFNLSAEGSVTIECSGTNKIETSGLNCHVEIGSQGPLSGVTYHNIETGGNKEVTSSSLVGGIAYSSSGTECPYGTQSNGEITTWNAIFTGSRNGAMVPVEWE